MSNDDPMRRSPRQISTYNLGVDKAVAHVVTSCLSHTGCQEGHSPLFSFIHGHAYSPKPTKVDSIAPNFLDIILALDRFAQHRSMKHPES
jgi:hypothetical protein